MSAVFGCANCISYLSWFIYMHTRVCMYRYLVIICNFRERFMNIEINNKFHMNMQPEDLPMNVTAVVISFSMTTP
jgi:hypothetical protein